jgi:hypothetical protein
MGGWGDGGGIELVGGKGHSFDGGHSFFFFFFCSFCTLAIFPPFLTSCIYFGLNGIYTVTISPGLFITTITIA